MSNSSGGGARSVTRRRRLSLAATAVVAVLLAALGVALATPARAASITATGENSATTGEATAATNLGGSGSIVIHLPSSSSSTSSTTNYNYKVYKVFDATVANSTTASGNPISYTAFHTVSGNTDVPNITGSGNKFIRDDAGNVYYGTESETTSAGAIAIKVNGDTKYVTIKTGELEASEVETVNTAIRAYLSLNDDNAENDKGLTADVDVANTYNTLKITGLPYGYYYITTSVGSAVALTSTNPQGEIQSKNDVPSIEKTITAVDDGTSGTNNTKGSVQDDGKRAIGEVGSTVHYQSVIQVKKGAVNYVFRDTMDGNLEYSDNLKVYTKVGDATETEVQASTGEGESATTNYTKYETASTTSEDTYTIKVAFEDTFVKGLADNVTADTQVQIIVRYTAKVTSNALQANPAKNSATISYGNDPSHTSTPSETEVYNAKLTVTKLDETTSQGLAGASFVVAKGAGTAENPYTYYKYTKATGSDPASISWVSSIDEATALTSDSNGKVELSETTTDETSGTSTTTVVLDGFVGLADGSYTLIEKTAPDGYNKADPQTFEVKAATDGSAFTKDATTNVITNLVHAITVNDRAGTALPSTGGVGTTVFYVVGGLMVAGAVALVVMRRRNGQVGQSSK